MPSKARSKAAEILFDLTATLEPRVKPLRQWFFDSINLTDVWFESEGTQGVKRMKDCLSWAWSTLLGEKPLPLDFVKSKGGCPTVVEPLVRRIQALKLDRRLMSAVQTLVRLTDFWEGVPEDKAVQKSLAIINDTKLPGTAKVEIERFSEFVPLFFKAYPSHPLTKAFFKAIPLSDDNTYLYRQSKGPNGPLIGNAHLDWLSLLAPTSKGTTLQEEVVNLENLLCGFATQSFVAVDRLGPAIEAYGRQRLRDQTNPSVDPGKLSFKNEKGGKVRIVAQPDYFSQLALKPVHDWLMGVLRKIPSDYTFDQRAAIPQICKWQTEGSGYTCSFDQSACTDRFPFDYQLVLISHRFGEPVMESFRTVVADRTWRVTLPSGSTRRVRWSVGQPLGMFGSWPLMALTHHLLVQYCYWITRGRSFRKEDPFQRYAICGDDIVIGDKAVARQYLLLTKRLGMVVNMSKSHESGGDTGVPPISEFAKITIWRGNPLTPIRPKMVLSAVLDSRCVLPLFFDLVSPDTWSARFKHLELMIKKYFPREKHILTTLLTLPREFGGLGLRDDRSLRRLFDQLSPGEIHPLIYYIADRVRAMIKKEQARLASSESLASTIPSQLFSVHPYLEYLRDKQKQIRWKENLWGSNIPSTLQLASEIAMSGFGAYSRLLDDDSAPDYPFEPHDQKVISRETSWLRALSKKHFLKPGPSLSLILGTSNGFRGIEAMSALTDPERIAFTAAHQDPEGFIEQQLAVVKSFLLAKRSLARECERA